MIQMPWKLSTLTKVQRSTQRQLLITKRCGHYFSFSLWLISESCQELKKLQLELNKFKTENKELKLQFAEQGTSKQAKRSKGSNPSKKRRSDGEDDVWQDRVAL